MRLLLLLLAASILSACGLLDGKFLDPDVNSIEQVEAFIGQPLPAAASQVRYEVQGFTDTFVRLRFTAPAADAERFLEQIGMTSLEAGGDPTRFYLDSSLDWWQPGNTRTFVTGEADRQPINRYYRVLVDQTVGERWMVYLVVFST